PALIFPCGLCCNPAGHFRPRWQKTCSTTRVRVVSGTVAPVYERPGYRTLLGRIRENVRTYIRKQLELPRQEIAEILAANERAALLLTIALAVGTGAMGVGRYSRLELHGPTRTIKSMKETVQWAKQRLLGRSAS